MRITRRFFLFIHSLFRAKCFCNLSSYSICENRRRFFICSDALIFDTLNFAVTLFLLFMKRYNRLAPLIHLLFWGILGWSLVLARWTKHLNVALLGNTVPLILGTSCKHRQLFSLLQIFCFGLGHKIVYSTNINRTLFPNSISYYQISGLYIFNYYVYIIC